MDQSSKHDMGHFPSLLGDGRDDIGVIVAMARGPPRCDPIEELAAIGKV